MEDHTRQRTQQLAAVVRDFSPSRLERQLLVQAFELAWKRSQATLPIGGAGSAAASIYCEQLSTVSLSMPPQSTRR